MAITTAFCTSFKTDLLTGTHQVGDVYKIALYTNAATLDASTSAYSATNEVVGVGYVAGGATLVGFTISLDGTTAILDWTTDPTWAAATITSRGALIYNSTRSNKAMGVYDFGADITSTAGTFTATLPAPTAAAGLLKIA